MAEDVIPLGWAVGGMVAAGLAAFLRGWFAWHGRVEAALAAQDWFRADGRVVESEVVRMSAEDGYVYEPRVRVAYRFQGQQHQGDQSRIGARRIYCRSRDDARLTLAPFPHGAGVRVYVDPTDFSRAVLEARATASGLGAWLALGFGLIVSAFAMLYWLG